MFDTQLRDNPAAELCICIKIITDARNLTTFCYQLTNDNASVQK